MQLKEEQYAIHIKDRVLNQIGDFSGQINIQGTDGTLSFAGYHTEGFSQNGHNGGAVSYTHLEFCHHCTGRPPMLI